VNESVLIYIERIKVDLVVIRLEDWGGLINDSLYEADKKSL
jgi:hypothetical protein